MKILYLQPFLANYRLPVLRALAEKHDVKVVAQSRAPSQAGFDSSSPGWSDHLDTEIVSWLWGRMFFQRRVLSATVAQRPDAVLTFANTRFASYWLMLVLCRLLRIRVFSHGQGLYSHPSPSMPTRLLFRAACGLSTRYICYAEVVRQSLVEAGCDPDKLRVASNSLALEHLVRPEEKTYRENGVLFIGRLRAQSGLELLVEAIQTLRDSEGDIRLHVIGDGEDASRTKRACAGHGWISWYGPIYDDLRVAEISRDCRIGCYPGDAGLSVVHFFGLSVPPLVHDTLHDHMGPEPSYVKDGINGFLYQKIGGTSALGLVLRSVWKLDPEQLRSVGERAFDTYSSLNSPPLGRRILEILEHH